jgi:hypothetical protein
MQVALLPGSKAWASTPRARSACNTPVPDINEISRSAEATAHQHRHLAQV